MKEHSAIFGVLAAMVILALTVVGLSMIDKKEDGPVLLAIAGALGSTATALGVIAQKSAGVPSPTPLPQSSTTPVNPTPQTSQPA